MTNRNMPPRRTPKSQYSSYNRSGDKNNSSRLMLGVVMVLAVFVVLVAITLIIIWQQLGTVTPTVIPVVSVSPTANTTATPDETSIALAVVATLTAQTPSERPTETLLPPTDTPIPPPDTPTAIPATDTATSAPPAPLPTDTPLPPPTNTPEPPPTSPPAPGGFIPVAGLPVLYAEEFKTAEIGWNRYGANLKNGEIVLNYDHWIDRPQGAVAHANLQFDNFILEVDSRWSGGAVGGTWGVLFRFENWDNYYVVYIRNDGRFEIGKNAEGKWSELAAGFSDAIDRNGGNNRFHIESNGDNFRFFINNQSIGTINDIEHDLGDIVFRVVKPAGADFFEVSYDNLIVVKHP